MSELLSPAPGDRFDLDHGTIRVDRVTEDEIYFARGDTPIRMPLGVWREAVRRYLTRDEEESEATQ